MAAIFHGPKLKIERAKHHINDLHRRLKIFEATNFYRLLIEYNPNTDKNILKVTQTQPIPDDFALVIGDALHNLKSALDFSVSDVLLKVIGRRSKHAKFPVYSTRDSLVGAIKGGDINQAPKEIIDFIVDVVKPYDGGNEAICALHEFDILDKHMLLLPVVQFGVLTDFALENDRGAEWTGLTFGLETGIVYLPQRGKLKITNNGQASMFMYFDKGLPFENKPIIPTLIQFAELVSGIIESFERAV